MFSFTLLEKVTLAVLLLASLVSVVHSTRRFRNIIRRGKGTLAKFSFKKAFQVLLKKTILLSPTWKTRFWSNLFHLAIVWGFLYYLFANLLDLLVVFIGKDQAANSKLSFTLLATDLISGLVLISGTYFLIRRLLFPRRFKVNENVVLIPGARKQIRRDSLIVCGLILIHVGSHVAAQSILLQINADHPFLPLAGFFAPFWNPDLPLETIGKTFFWVSILSLLLFIPYFPYSKHIHILFAPMNFIFKPKSPTLSHISAIDLDNETEISFGAQSLGELEQISLLDSFACIMCFRCQDVCPPYAIGSQLSPAAYEINKRLYLKMNGKEFALAAHPDPILLDFALSESALWDCTACGACVEICPVGIDPLADILQIRRGQVLMQDQFPKTYQLLFRNVERTANPWGMSPQNRMDWAAGLHVKTVLEQPNPNFLWWVGCAGAFDENAQRSSQAFAQILEAAQVDYAVLGEAEHCTGDSMRRAGREDLYQQMAITNIELIQSTQAARIVTNCPHCLNSLKNEYREFGANFEVLHSSQLITELVTTGAIKLKGQIQTQQLSYHDPCYLSRFNTENKDSTRLLNMQNQILDSHPNQDLHTFCCGAGGAQYWKDSGLGSGSIADLRWRQLTSKSPQKVITACPFCMSMLQSAAAKDLPTAEIFDICEFTLMNLQIEAR